MILYQRDSSRSPGRASAACVASFVTLPEELFHALCGFGRNAITILGRAATWTRHFPRDGAVGHGEAPQFLELAASGNLRDARRCRVGTPRGGARHVQSSQQQIPARTHAKELGTAHPQRTLWHADRGANRGHVQLWAAMRGQRILEPNHDIGVLAPRFQIAFGIAGRQAIDKRMKQLLLEGSSRSGRWVQNTGRTGQIATNAFEADPALVAHHARNSCRLNLWGIRRVQRRNRIFGMLQIGHEVVRTAWEAFDARCLIIDLLKSHHDIVRHGYGRRESSRSRLRRCGSRH